MQFMPRVVVQIRPRPYRLQQAKKEGAQVDAEEHDVEKLNYPCVVDVFSWIGF